MARPHERHPAGKRQVDRVCVRGSRGQLLGFLVEGRLHAGTEGVQALAEDRSLFRGEILELFEQAGNFSLPGQVPDAEGIERLLIADAENIGFGLGEELVNERLHGEQVGVKSDLPIHRPQRSQRRGRSDGKKEILRCERKLHNLGECRRAGHGKIGEDLSIEEDFLLREGGDEP